MNTINVTAGDTQRGSYTLTYDGMAYGFTELDGVFPDVQRVDPGEERTRGVEIIPANFNPELLMDFRKLLAGQRRI